MTQAHRTRVPVTGTSGFLGGNLLSALAGNPAITRIDASLDRAQLAPSHSGAVRVGDLRDAGYRRALAEDVDVICHAGTWASMQAHRREERERFYEPARDLIEQAISHGVTRFLMASTVAIGAVTRDGTPHDDCSAKRHAGFWPHLEPDGPR
jgi:nucleoside-diphosphate-sugar epimerase